MIHQAPLREDDVTRRDGIPVTTPLRSVADVAADPSVARTAAQEALERDLVRAHELRRLVERCPELADTFSALLS